MKILLDTHILVRLGFGLLSPERVAILQQRDVEIYFASITLWEIAKLYELGRLKLDQDLETYFTQIEYHPRFKQVHSSSQVLAKMVEIAPSMHRDPSDQLIMASAIVLKARLMTDNQRLRALRLVDTV